MRILHAFADRGVESQALSNFGTVTRLTVDPVSNNYSSAIAGDCRNPPFDDSVQFDFGLLHPPCTKWSDMPSADTANAENLIPAARNLAEEYCDEWIIENKPRAPLRNPTILNGKMFGLPIKYERAFEASFDIPETPDEQSIETEISPYFYSDRSKEWWCSIKGCSTDFPKQHVAKNALPSAYVEFLVRKYFEATNTRDQDNARSTHSDPEPRRLQ